MAGDHINLVDFDHPLELHVGCFGREAFPQMRGHRVDVVLIQAQFLRDLAVGEVQPHEI